MQDCDTTKFTRKQIALYCMQLCKLIDMKPEVLYFWDDFHVPMAKRQTSPQTKGTTAIQFILTSNITIHTLDVLKSAFINIFSCKEYDTAQAEAFTVTFFSATSYKSTQIERGVF